MSDKVERVYVILKKDTSSWFGHWWELRPKCDPPTERFGKIGRLLINGQWYGLSVGKSGYAMTKRRALAEAKAARVDYYSPANTDKAYEVHE